MRKLELIKEGSGSSTTYNKLNLNSITTADKDNVNLGSIYNNLRTVSIRIELTDDINTVTNNGIYTILARYNTGNLTGGYFIRFNNGNIQFLFRNGTSFSQVLSNNNSWTNGQVIDISVQFNSTLGRIMYIDGVLQTNQFSTLKTDSGTSVYNTYLGGTVDADTQYAFFKGDNLQFWTKELTSTEINSYIGVIPTAGTTGLVECFPFANETGFTVTGVNGNTGTISTLNAGGVTYVDNTMREDYSISNGTPLETFEFDLYDDEPISVNKKGIDINDLSERTSGTTNSFKLPLTSNNNRILDYLEVEGNLTNTPYEINYVRYTQDSVELISKGRLNIKGIDSDGYDVDIIHGINSFFDLIRGKYLWEAYEPYRTTLNEMVSTQTTLTNDLTVTNNEGYIVSLMDLGNISPIPEYQQQISYFLDFGIDKIAYEVGYNLTNLDVDLNELVFTPNDVPIFDSIKKQFGGNFTFLGAGNDYTLFSYVLEKKSYLYFDLKTIQGLATISDTPTIQIKVNGIVVFSDLVPDGGSGYVYTNSFDSTPTIYEQGDIVEVEMTSTTTYGAVQGRNYGFNCLGLFDDNFEVYHENFLKDYTQEDFIKNIRQLLNVGFNVNDTFKTIEIFSINNIFSSSYGNIIDLSDYFDKVISKSFLSDYGKNNLFTYTYQDNQSPFADGVLVANNYNKEKKLIESDLTPSLNNTEFTLGTDTVFLTTAKTYEDTTVGSKKEDIGNRINKVLRYDTSGSNPVTVDYIDVLGTPSTIDSNQSILSFTGLDWQTLIENNYSNIRDKVLNRYSQYKVSMNVPFYIIKDFDFKDKVFIDSIGANFVVEEIKTLPNGLSEWTLIKLNEV